MLNDLWLIVSAILVVIGLVALGVILHHRKKKIAGSGRDPS